MCCGLALSFTLAFDAYDGRKNYSSSEIFFFLILYSIKRKKRKENNVPKGSHNESALYHRLVELVFLFMFVYELRVLKVTEPKWSVCSIDVEY